MENFTNGQILFLAIGALGLGIYMLIKGGDMTIRSAVYVARELGVPPLLVGFTIVGFGTSLPEMIVAVNANLKGSGGIAIGNVLGSNIANILLVIGAAACVTTLIAKPKELWRDILMMLVATAIMTGLMLHGQISTIAGSGMILLLLGYVFWQYKTASAGELDLQEVSEPDYPSMALAAVALLSGLALIALGAEFLVRGAKTSAEIIGIPDAVIGLTVVAVGTSLPELATCIAAAKRRQTDILLGNIIGSNVFNILSILGVAALFKPFDQTSITPEMVSFDMLITGAVALAFSILVITYKKITRSIGLVMLGAYGIYILTLVALYWDQTKAIMK